MAEIRRSAVGPRARVDVLGCLLFEEDRAGLLIKDTFAKTMRLGDGVMTVVAKIVELFILTGARVQVFCLREELRNWKNLTERLGLKRGAPVPLCLDMLYLPRGDSFSGFSYLPAPGLWFCGSMDMVRSIGGSLLRMVKVGALLSFRLSYFSVSYLLGAGTLRGSRGMCPLSGKLWVSGRYVSAEIKGEAFARCFVFVKDGLDVVFGGGWR